uniref:Fibrinogen C-terminal domain-containing protein n=1 Tax=Magallana gigas TaxID=29159 RepID=A0A8W8LLH2_MAGGI|nr:fibrinogen-like protein 1 [Crassostrea gigas]
MFDESASCKFLLFVLFACDTSAISPSSNFVYDGDVQYEDNNNTLSEVSMPPGQASTISCCINCLMNTSCKAVEICLTPSENKCRLSKGVTNTTGTAAGATCKRYKMKDKCGGEGYTGSNGHCIYDGCQSCDCVGVLTHASGVYGITIGGNSKLVYCSFENGLSWTVIQRREDGSENFNRTWTDYELGFGSPASEVWLGNKYTHQLTVEGHSVLRIELEDFSGNKRYAEYSSFSLADVTDNYRIQVTGYTGDAGDSFSGPCTKCNNGMPFSTYDRENDNAPNDMYYGHCAQWAKGGWWFNACHRSNLNGWYGDSSYAQGITWEAWKGFYDSLKSSTMKIRKL